jgi:hypothetical protein
MFGSQLFGLADANPFVGVPIVDPVEGTTPPSIEVISPQNGTTYPPLDVVTFSFNVNKPELANASKTVVIWVYYLLDDQPSMLRTEVYSVYNSADNDSALGKQNVTYSTRLTLPEGSHKLTIYAAGVVYSGGGIFGVDSNSTVLFTVGSPSLPSTTENNVFGFSAEVLYAIAIALVVVIVGVAMWIVKRAERTGRPEKT